MEMKEVRQRARELMKGYCRVCPVCDGRACVGEIPGMGGVGTGASFQANLAALAALRLNMRVVHEVTAPDLSREVLGRTLALPILAAPIGGVSFNMGGGMSEGDYVKAVLQGCAQAGVVGCTGDGAPPFIIEAALEGIASVGGAAIPFIKPWGDEELFAKLERCRQAGAMAVGMDIDAAGLITLALMGRPVSPKPVAKLKEIIARVGLPVILKGVMTPEDAILCAEAGAAGIVVSNHGGRVLDHTPGVAEALPAVAAAAKDRLAILADGGVRGGVDVLKLLALGAQAVMIGRPFSVAALGGGKDGVAAYLAQLKAELTTAMILTGTRSVRAVGPDTLWRRA